MNSKKVAILTINDDDNYGNRLQNYATQKILEHIGHKPETIRNKEGIYNYSVGYYKQIIKNNIKKLFPIKKEYRRFKKFNNFNKNIKFSRILIDKQHINNKLIPSYDYFITGSDQVWNPYFSRTSEVDFLTFAPKNKRVSLAASFGVSEIPKEKINAYKAFLYGFKDISVRENEGKQIIEELTGREDVKVLLDPTMLLTRREWIKIAKKPRNMFNEKYILNYFLGELSKERKELIDSLASKNGWKVINILNRDSEFYESGPAEFLYLEANAEMICTDSFHSCVFGIVFETPFIVFSREDNHNSMNSRIDTLLNTFELGNQYYRGGNLEEYMCWNIDRSNLILEEKRYEGIDFIKNSLT